MQKVLFIVATALAGYWALRQVRKPSGWLGRQVVRGMNLSHAVLTDWALGRIEVPQAGTLLDIGCGGGRTVQRLAKLSPGSRVIGLDYSQASVAASRATNANEIEAGRVQIELSSVASLPHSDRSIDLVTAVETHYYWPDLLANTREVLRVLKPGGTFALVAETCRDGLSGTLYALPMRLIGAAHLSEAEHRELLVQAGFTGVRTDRFPGHGWICAVGHRPADS